MSHLIPVVKVPNWRIAKQERLTTDQAMLLSHLENQKDLSMLTDLTGWPLPFVMKQLRQLIREDLVELCRRGSLIDSVEEAPTPPPRSTQAPVAVQKGTAHTRQQHPPQTPPPRSRAAVFPKKDGQQHRHDQEPTPLAATLSLSPTQTLQKAVALQNQRPPLSHTLEPYEGIETPQPTLQLDDIAHDTQEDLIASPTQAANPQSSRFHQKPQRPPLQDWSMPVHQPHHLHFDPTEEEIPRIKPLHPMDVTPFPNDSFQVRATPQAPVRSLQNATPHSESEPTSVPPMNEDKEVVLTGEPTLIPKKEKRRRFIRVEKSSKRKG
ncbi:MAG: hypothetical protein EP343_06830 [Deltaproteobacteria bacterium]|nr:MAG: hypothetical protein EP343_06830 [Deltaproteobacteria bacterium]